MRCTTLRAVTPARVARLLDYYAGLAEDAGKPCRSARGPVDYYLDPAEPAGRWWGSGRLALGVDGEVCGEELRALLEARHPITGQRLGREFGAKSARGFDATFSAPKSVSVLWALTPDRWVRAEVLAAHDAAVDAALGWLEAHGAVTRRGTDGVDQVDTRGLTAALFRQHTSRTLDPQLHTHALVMAKVQDPTGHWLALDARFLKRQQRTIGWLYDAALRAELSSRLGVAWVGDDERPVNLQVIPDELREVFSERSAQVAVKLDELIVRWSAEHDGTEPDPKTIAMLERRAVTASRSGKVDGLDAEAMHAEWTAQAHRARFESASLSADRLRSPVPAPAATDEAHIIEALERLQAESATWLSADVARHLSNLVPARPGQTGAEVVAEVDRLADLAIERCVALGPDRDAPRRRDGSPVAEPVTDRLFTTSAALDEEQDLQDWAQRSSVPPLAGLESQEAAVAAMTSHAPLVLVVGPAGTGKTTTTGAAVQTLRSQGRPVVGLAPSGKAADVLATEAGCDTDTVAGFLTRHRHQPTRWPAGTTVVLDEAAMTATPDLAELVALVRQHRWRLVAIGDPAQLPAVGRGGVFAHWCDTVPHVELDTLRRFHESWEAQASLQLRAGDPAAVETYAEHGRLHAVHPVLLGREVARRHQRLAGAGHRVAITASTAETARAINLAIQHANPQPGPRIPMADWTSVRVGDQIATRRNDPDLISDRGERVRNRHVWTVTAIHQSGALAAFHPDRGRVELPAHYVADHVELGWAVTGYGNQGDTVDVGIAVLEPGTSRSHAYVAMTRGRATNQAFIVDAIGIQDPGEALADMIGRSPARGSALATRTRLHHDAGIPEVPLEVSASPASVEAARIEALQRRLDALEPRSSVDRPLGL
jgi:conjugative relaxase-like TrwC/TraI family protein